MKSITQERRRFDRALQQSPTLLRALQRNHDLLRALSEAQSRFIADADPYELFRELLTSLLSLTQSKYGFIGEVVYKANGEPDLDLYAVCDIGSNAKISTLYEVSSFPNVVFDKLDSHLKAVLETENAVIINKPVRYIGSSKLAQKHRRLSSISVMPIHHAGKLVGMVGIADRREGYDMAMVSYLKPFLMSYGNIIEAYRNDQRRKQAEKALHERLHFETLLSDISITFINLPTTEIDKNIEIGLKRIVECLEIDRGSLLEFTNEKTQLSLTWSYAREDIQPASYISVSEKYPWVTEILRSGKTCCISGPDELPDEAWHEKQYFLEQGVKSIALIPLSVGGDIVGAIGFSSILTERKWPDDLIQRLRLLGEIIASALIRKKSMEALRKSEDKYRILFESANEGILVIKGDKFIDCNKKALEMSGNTKDQLIGQTPWAISLPIQSNGKPSKEMWREMLELAYSGKAMVFDWIYRRQDAQFIDIEVSLAKIDIQDEPALLCYWRDITGRKRTEEVQRQRNKILEILTSGASLKEVFVSLVSAVEQANPGTLCSILLLDKEGKQLRYGFAPNLPNFYNEAIDRLTIGPNIGSCGAAAYRKERVIVKDIMTHENWAGYRKLAARAGVRACWSEPIISSTGTVLGTFAMYYGAPRGPSHWEMEFIQNSAQLAGIAIERKLTENALLESESQLRLLTDVLPVLISYIDSEERYRFSNKVHEDWLGIPQYRIMGKSIRSVLGNSTYRAIKQYIKTVLSGHAVSFNHRVPFKDGKVRYIHADLIPHFASAENTKGFFALITDITAHKESEDALQKALSEVALLKDQLQADNVYLQEEIKLNHNFEEIVGRSEELKKVLYKVEQVATTDTTVLIQGETGTGKELLARAIHSLSSRRDRPLIKVNCATLPVNLAESELFGHEKGAFTGALVRLIGRFELANGATIFLDEVGELPLGLQAKLLRVLQEGELERVGNPHTIKVDVRVIAATNRDLSQEVKQGGFRADLYYRLNVFPLHVPPLRDRKGDISLLVRILVNKFSQRIGKTIDTIPLKVIETFQKYTWPGNIRELENIIERAVILSQGKILQVDDRLEITSSMESADTHNASLEEFERTHILQVLKDCDWKIEGNNGAAESLGMNPGTLRSRIRKLKIRRP